MARAKNTAQEEMHEIHSKEIAVRDEMMSLLKEKIAFLESYHGSEEEERPSLRSGLDPSTAETIRIPEVLETSLVYISSATRKMTLPLWLSLVVTPSRMTTHLIAGSTSCCDMQSWNVGQIGRNYCNWSYTSPPSLGGQNESMSSFQSKCRQRSLQLWNR